MWKTINSDSTFVNNSDKFKHSQELPLEVTLDNDLFEEYFDCDEYRNALAKLKISEKLQGGRPQNKDIDCLWCLRDKENDSIWMNIKVNYGYEKEPVRFNIRWKKRIYTTEKVAMLFPLSTLHALQVADTNKSLRYFPTKGGKSIRYKALNYFESNGSGINKHTLEKFTKCLNGKFGRGNTIRLPAPFLSAERITDCASQFNIPVYLNDENKSLIHEQFFLKAVSAVDGDIVRHDHDHHLILPSESISNSRYWNISKKIDKGFSAIDMLEADSGFRFLTLYIKDRESIFDVVEKLREITVIDHGEEVKALDISPTYFDSLTRFGFISDIMGMVRTFIFPLILLFIFLILLAQIGIVTNHRKHYMGVLLSKGFSSRQICYIIYSQVIFCYISAYIFSGLIIYVIEKFINSHFRHLFEQKHYNDYINLADLDILLISRQEYLVIFTIGLFLIFVITFLQLRFSMKITIDPEPSKMLYT